MIRSSLRTLKIKAKLLQKAKVKSGKVFALKDAYALIARTAGYGSWKEMRDDYEKSDLFNPPTWSAQWKTWYSDKGEALSHLKEGLYLVPHRKQFFICDQNYLRALGIEINDVLLAQVGNDWSAPLDQGAFSSLLQKIKAHHDKL